MKKPRKRRKQKAKAKHENELLDNVLDYGIET